MLIKIDSDWIDPASIWRITYDAQGKMMCIYLSRNGEHARSIAVNADQAYVDAVAKQVNEATSGKNGG